MNTSPPKVPLRFFRWFCRPELRDSIEGDLTELFHERVKERSKRNANIKLWVDVLMLCRPGIVKPLKGYQTINNNAMIRSYFKIAWRNLLKNKGYSFINVGGLALGMAVAIMIGLWIYDEVTFNQYHRNYKQVGQVYQHKKWHDEIIANTFFPAGVGTLLKNEYASHFQKVTMIKARNDEHVIGWGGNLYTQVGYFMQGDGVDIFSLWLIEGNSQCLTDMNSIILSQSLAKKLFGDKDPLHQVVTFDGKWDLTVTGVYEDLPRNSVFQDATYFAPLDLNLRGSEALSNWDNYNINIYVQLAPHESFDHVSGIIKKAMLTHPDEMTVAANPQLFVLPMSDWHLANEFKDGKKITSARMTTVWYYGAIGGIVLLLACINFMNLTTARSENRAREVGIRKSIGSLRFQLINQFYSESFVVALAAFVVALCLVQVTLPAFNNISGKALTMPWFEPMFWLAAAMFIITTALLAGSYPALYLSAFNPAKVLKGTYKAGRFASLPRKFLVTVQFSASVFLIIGTTIIYQQLQLGKDRAIGYSRKGLLSLHPRTPEFNGKYEALRNELKKTGVVTEIAESDYSLTSTLGWNDGFDWKGKDANAKDLSFNINTVTVDYGKTVGWEVVSGHDFSRAFTNESDHVIINESAARAMGMNEPIGETLTRMRDGVPKSYGISGVVKDVVKGSPFERTDPCLYFLSENTLGWLYIRVNPETALHDALPKIENTFRQLVPSAPFDYTFADDDYAAKFITEERTGTVAALFSALAIFISCLGLFGLASFVAEQRTREIGIRKILGAGTYSLWKMQSAEFIVLVAISCFIASPLAFLFMTTWLRQYQFHVPVSGLVVSAACASALVITIITVSYQAIKAANMSPVKSLRSE